ncbi:MAG TPA: metal-dependent hydrolase [Methanomassiliicoccales archaeon]|jgi:L-ascorbate metabolism protein UlaG (beta-lactamase superfamily)
MVKLRYLGHSAFTISDVRNTVIIDPFLTGNSEASFRARDIEADLILVTHAHNDHLGDAIEISKRSGSPILCSFELGMYCESQGAKVINAHIGGKFKFDFGSVKLFPALHSSSLDDIHPLGTAVSFMINMEGKNMYHAGDTALFGDMALIAEQYKIDVAMLPIGGIYTMDSEDAVRAERLLRAKKVVPMHYGKWSEADPYEFRDRIGEQGIGTAVVMRPGDAIIV